MDILIGFSVTVIFTIFCLTLIALKLLSVLSNLLGVPDEASAFKNLFKRMTPKEEVLPDEAANPLNPEDLPLDQFRPRSDKPLKVNYTEDEEGNSMTEVIEDEDSR